MNLYTFYILFKAKLQLSNVPCMFLCSHHAHA